MNDNIREEKTLQELSNHTIYKYETLNKHYTSAELINNEIKANISAYQNLSEECETTQDYKSLFFTAIAQIQLFSDMLTDSLDDIRVFNNNYVLNDGKNTKINPYGYEFSLKILGDR